MAIEPFQLLEIHGSIHKPIESGLILLGQSAELDHILVAVPATISRAESKESPVQAKRMSGPTTTFSRNCIVVIAMEIQCDKLIFEVDLNREIHEPHCSDWK